MWQNLLHHCAVLTKVSEEFAPHYLAGIRHDMRQTTPPWGVGFAKQKKQSSSEAFF
jgi:hypothetical protein